MRYAVIVIFAVALIGYLMKREPSCVYSLGGWGQTIARIGIFYQHNNRLPADLSELPARTGYLKGTTDPWQRPLEYKVHPDGTFTLSSLGEDGIAGGTELNTDLKLHYHIVDGHVEPLP
jgi:hypothetical protein